MLTKEEQVKRIKSIMNCETIKNYVVYGQTFDIRDALKMHGGKWDHKNKWWYFELLRENDFIFGYLENFENVFIREKKHEKAVR